MENIKEEKIYTIPLNVQNHNLYVKIVDGEVSYLVDDAISFLTPFIKIMKNNNCIDIYLLSKKCFSIENGVVNQHTSYVTSTELRNISEMIRNNSNENFTINQGYFSRSGLMLDDSLNTELHTHLIEMLDGASFINFVRRFNGNLRLNTNGVFDFREGNYFTVDEVKEVPGLYNFVISQLEIPVNRVGDFLELEKKVENRTRLLLDVITLFASSNGLGSIEEARELVTKVLLHDSLIYLRNSGVKYVEISHSNLKLITGILNSLDEVFYNDISGIDFRFLLSSSRLRSAKDFRQSGRYLDGALSNKSVVGFDIMGLESKFSSGDLEQGNRDSLYKKLLPIITSLSKYDNSVLRLHSGEFVNTDTNTEQLLEVIASIEADLKITIPPPEIRIGHGIHIDKSPRLIELMRRYNCIVEINASSNFALHNIENLREIPYKFYIENGIRVVLSTDGGGFYGTTPSQEKFIAQTFARDELDRIVLDDKNIYQQKIGGVIHDKSTRR